MLRRSIFLLILIVFLLACNLPLGTAVPQPVSATPIPPTPKRATPTPRPVRPTPTPTPIFPDAFDAVKMLGRGVNMGNSLEAPVEGRDGFIIKPEHFDAIRAAGFDSVRIPVRWTVHALESAPYTIDPDFLARVDEVVGWALERDLAVVLNMHHYEEMASDPEAHQERFYALWAQLAEHYKDYPPELVFELMNEPNLALQADLWNEMVVKGLDVIRESNRKRCVIIGGVSWNAYHSLKDLNLPVSDRYLIATFHYYYPFKFTHQGADWAGDEPLTWLGTTWDATDAEKEAIAQQFDEVVSFSKRYRVPIYLGEFGTYYKAPQDSRVRWMSYIREQAEARGFAWAYWEFSAGFGLYDLEAGQWRTDMLEALTP